MAHPSVRPSGEPMTIDDKCGGRNARADADNVPRSGTRRRGATGGEGWTARLHRAGVRQLVGDILK